MRFFTKDGYVKFDIQAFPAFCGARILTGLYYGIAGFGNFDPLEDPDPKNKDFRVRRSRLFADFNRALTTTRDVNARYLFATDNSYGPIWKLAKHCKWAMVTPGYRNNNSGNKVAVFRKTIPNGWEFREPSFYTLEDGAKRDPELCKLWGTILQQYDYNPYYDDYGRA